MDEAEAAVVRRPSVAGDQIGCLTADFGECPGQRRRRVLLADEDDDADVVTPDRDGLLSAEGLPLGKRQIGVIEVHQVLPAEYLTAGGVLVYKEGDDCRGVDLRHCKRQHPHLLAYLADFDFAFVLRLGVAGSAPKRLYVVICGLHVECLRLAGSLSGVAGFDRDRACCRASC